MNDKLQKKKTTVLDKIMITLFTIIIIISVGCVAVVYLMNTRFFKNNETPDSNGKLDETIVTPTEVKSKAVTFLIAGIDYLEGSSRGKLTDVMMVVNFDIQGKNIDILQIPRDTYIGSDYPTGKMNAVYGMKNGGGIEGLANKIYTMFNLPIDHYATMNMNGFRSLVDKIGGVDVYVEKGFTLEEVTFEPGMQHVDGFRAEKLVRERHSYANQDLGRIQVQQTFMKAIIEKVFTMKKTDILKLAPSMMKDITTDLNLGEMLGYYEKAIDIDRATGINFHVLPTMGATVGKSSVLSIQKYPAADLLNENFRPYTRKISADEFNVIEVNTNYDHASNPAGNASSTPKKKPQASSKPPASSAPPVQSSSAPAVEAPPDIAASDVSSETTSDIIYTQNENGIVSSQIDSRSGDTTNHGNGSATSSGQ